MKSKVSRVVSALLSVLLCFSIMLNPALATNASSQTDERLKVDFTLDEFIACVEGQGFEVEIIGYEDDAIVPFANGDVSTLKITRDLPSEMVTPLGEPLPGKAYMYAKYEEDNLTGIPYARFLSVIGYGIEMKSSMYNYDGDYSDYRFTNGNYSVEWWGTGQCSYTTSTSISASFGWVGVSTGDSFTYRSPAYAWEFSYDLPQPV